MEILLINPTIREHEPPISFPIGVGIIANIMLQNNLMGKPLVAHVIKYACKATSDRG